MKRATSLLLVPAFVLATHAATPDSSYIAGDHAAALKGYMVLELDSSSADLFYNIGNCHFKLGNKAEAVLWYERAYRLAPGDADIRTNLDLARAQVVDRINTTPGIAIGGGLSTWFAGRTIDTWAIRSLWACTAAFVLLALSLFIGTTAKRVLRIAAASAGVFTLVAFGLAAHRSSMLHDDGQAIVMAPKVDVKSEPRGAGTTVFVLHEGTKVSVTSTSDEWCEIELANGTVGWMKQSELERI